MRAELPWNVAGIPPEARDAARAAARREGLSVGEWLTRRILRGLSDPGDEADAPPERGPQLDSWGLPQSTASRRDTEEMLARVNRSEAESGDTWRRIEEQLRGVARRLDSSERSQSESNRVLSRTAAEMNIAAREQSQAFEQISQGMENLNRRLDALENSRTHEALKDAVKGLHLGLTRLADQISNTASQSANQIAMVAGNLEQVAARLSDVRAETRSAATALEERFITVEKIAHSGAGAVERLEQRLGIIEKSAGEAIGHGIARLEQRLGLVETSHGESFAPLLHRLGEIEKTALEQLGPGLEKLGHQLGAVEHAAGERLEAGLGKLEHRLGIMEQSAQAGAETAAQALERLEQHAGRRAEDRAEFERHTGHMQAALDRLDNWVGQLHDRIAEPPAANPATGARLERIEQSLNGLSARLEQPEAALESNLMELAHRIDALEQNHDELMQELNSLKQPEMPAQGFAGPSVTRKQAQEFPPPAQPGTREAPPFAAPEPDVPVQEHDFADLGQEPGQRDFGAQDGEAGYSRHAGLEDDAAGHESFLSAARRSARTASERVESEIRGRSFAWNTQEIGEGQRRPRFLMLGVLALVVLAALATGLVLSQRQRAADVAKAAPPRTAPAAPKAEAPLPALAPPPVEQPAPGPVKAGPVASPVASPRQPASPARIIQLANAGNMVAQTILGLRYLDGTGGTKANPADAAKFLSQAAEKGQPVAQYRYGTMFERGQGVAADPAKALRWYEAAANQGNRKAMHNLAVAYAEGAGTAKDMVQAALWFGRAAGLGLSDSQFNLAVLYERGDGVPRSLTDAYKWYAIAAAQGDAESRQRLTMLRAGMAASERAAAQREAANFHAAQLGRAANVPPEPGDLAN